MFLVCVAMALLRCLVAAVTAIKSGFLLILEPFLPLLTTGWHHKAFELTRLKESGEVSHFLAIFTEYFHSVGFYRHQKKLA